MKISISTTGCNTMAMIRRSLLTTLLSTLPVGGIAGDEAPSMELLEFLGGMLETRDGELASPLDTIRARDEGANTEPDRQATETTENDTWPE